MTRLQPTALSIAEDKVTALEKRLNEHEQVMGMITRAVGAHDDFLDQMVEGNKRVNLALNLLIEHTGVDVGGI